MINLGDLECFTKLNGSARKGDDFPDFINIPVREDNEVAIIYIPM